VGDEFYRSGHRSGVRNYCACCIGKFGLENEKYCVERPDRGFFDRKNGFLNVNIPPYDVT